MAAKTSQPRANKNNINIHRRGYKSAFLHCNFSDTQLLMFSKSQLVKK